MPPTLNLADGIDGLRGAWLYGLDSSPFLNEEIEQISGRWAWSRRGRGIGWRRNVCADDRPLMRHLSAMVTCCLRDEWSAARPSYSSGMRTRVFLMRWRFQVGLNDNSVEKVIIDCIPRLVNGGRGSWETCQLTNIIRTLLWSFNIYSINFVKFRALCRWKPWLIAFKSKLMVVIDLKFFPFCLSFTYLNKHFVYRTQCTRDAES